MVLAAVELRHVGEIIRLAVDSHAHEALLAHGLELVPELALATAHQRREHFDLGAFRPLEHQVGDLRRGLPLDRRSIVGAMRRTGAGPEQAEIVVDLRDRAHGGTWIRAGGLLLDGDRGRQTFDRIDVGLVHEPEELARIG